MNNRTAVLFLILCMVVLLGLLELEKMWQRDQQIKKDTQLTERSIAQEAQRKAEELEAKKFKVQIKHDGRPETNTVTVNLDAGLSYDPNKIDKLNYKWTQTSGKTVFLEPNSTSPKVSFIAGPGEYTFEIALSDGYGSTVKDVRIIKVIGEPNDIPVLETRVSSE